MTSERNAQITVTSTTVWGFKCQKICSDYLGFIQHLPGLLLPGSPEMPDPGGVDRGLRSATSVWLLIASLRVLFPPIVSLGHAIHPESIVPEGMMETLVWEGAVDFQPWSENHFRCSNNQEIFTLNFSLNIFSEMLRVPFLVSLPMWK